MKPTFNAISTDGTKVVSPSLDTCGFFARSVEDLHLLADIFRFPTETHVPAVSLEEANVAFIRSPIWPMAGSGTTTAMTTAANILRGRGVKTEELELPSSLNNADVLRQTHKVVLHTEARTAFLKDYLLDKHRTKLDPEIRAFVEDRPKFTIEETKEAVEKYADFRSVFDEFASKYSAIITPSAQDVAPSGMHDMGDSCFNFLWTVSAIQPIEPKAVLTRFSRGFTHL